MSSFITRVLNTVRPTCDSWRPVTFTM
jgi:hypothetical protein